MRRRMINKRRYHLVHANVPVPQRLRNPRIVRRPDRYIVSRPLDEIAVWVPFVMEIHRHVIGIPGVQVQTADVAVKFVLPEVESGLGQLTGVSSGFSPMPASERVEPVLLVFHVGEGREVSRVLY